jgi:hypothetical protein
MKGSQRSCNPQVAPLALITAELQPVGCIYAGGLRNVAEAKDFKITTEPQRKDQRKTIKQL